MITSRAGYLDYSFLQKKGPSEKKKDFNAFVVVAHQYHT